MLWKQNFILITLFLQSLLHRPSKCTNRAFCVFFRLITAVTGYTSLPNPTVHTPVISGLNTWYISDIYVKSYYFSNVCRSLSDRGHVWVMYYVFSPSISTKGWLLFGHHCDVRQDFLCGWFCDAKIGERWPTARLGQEQCASQTQPLHSL